MRVVLPHHAILERHCKTSSCRQPSFPVGMAPVGTRGAIATEFSVTARGRVTHGAVAECSSPKTTPERDMTRGCDENHAGVERKIFALRRTLKKRHGTRPWCNVWRSREKQSHLTASKMRYATTPMLVVCFASYTSDWHTYQFVTPCFTAGKVVSF